MVWCGVVWCPLRREGSLRGSMDLTGSHHVRRSSLLQSTLRSQPPRASDPQPQTSPLELTIILHRPVTVRPRRLAWPSLAPSSFTSLASHPLLELVCLPLLLLLLLLLLCPSPDSPSPKHPKQVLFPQFSAQSEPPSSDEVTDDDDDDDLTKTLSLPHSDLPYKPISSVQQPRLSICLATLRCRLLIPPSLCSFPLYLCLPSLG